MSGFPSLKPFATCLASIDPGIPIGPLSSGGSQIFVNVPSATIKSEPGVSPSFNASIVMGGDWIHADPDGKHMRLDVRTVIKTDDGEHLTYVYNGIINVTEGITKILSGAPDAKTVDFGDVFATPKFITGSEKYKYLENCVFVAGGRFVVTDSGVQVEYKISQVV